MHDALSGKKHVKLGTAILSLKGIFFIVRSPFTNRSPENVEQIPGNIENDDKFFFFKKKGE